ncbi:hypothetical protein PG997_014706 [Apiospora hydei]|uniref:Uncharacterized protein n=1 Tax=Apiospora hydei TaxID=1337664 RepID=A0ABR1UUK7_9PEZI
MRHPITAEKFTHPPWLLSGYAKPIPGLLCIRQEGLEFGPYGYTFVAKGALSDGLEHLRHECRIYMRLDTLQGWVVPVKLQRS